MSLRRRAIHDLRRATHDEKGHTKRVPGSRFSVKKKFKI
jgi:hypothetical protein